MSEGTFGETKAPVCPEKVNLSNAIRLLHTESDIYFRYFLLFGTNLKTRQLTGIVLAGSFRFSKGTRSLNTIFRTFYNKLFDATRTTLTVPVNNDKVFFELQNFVYCVTVSSFGFVSTYFFIKKKRRRLCRKRLTNFEFKTETILCWKVSPINKETKTKGTGKLERRCGITFLSNARNVGQLRTGNFGLFSPWKQKSANLEN